MSDDFTPAQIAAAERLLALVNPSADDAADQIARFREALAEPDEDRSYPGALVWLLKDVIDWESGYFVDWKDTESFVACLQDLCELWDVAVDWGVDDPLGDDFLDSTDVPALMTLAYDQLRGKGLTLWTWDTAGDCHGGWITRTADDPEVQQISQVVGLDFRPACDPF